MSVFGRLKEGLRKTRESFVGKIEGLIYGRTQVDEEFYEELEAILIQADVGVETSLQLVEGVRGEMRRRRLDDPTKLRPVLREKLREIFAGDTRATLNLSGKPSVIIVEGVNGTGKTTTIGKLAYLLKKQGKGVILAAADTFRAAAIEQLEIWGARAGAVVVRQGAGADPAAVVYDAIQAARARRCDVVIVDTAGRLHTKVNLMDELKKIGRVAAREVPGAPHEVLLVLDATTGHNALSQARIFAEATGVTGIVLTKLDGTAKGGIVVAIRRSLGIPVKFVGTGEEIEDLDYFDPDTFIEALCG
ncbi:MAG: signal recognition particle-docking protein FtsY [Bacillota bacterium]